jgi:hypothetical protein
MKSYLKFSEDHLLKRTHEVDWFDFTCDFQISHAYGQYLSRSFRGSEVPTAIKGARQDFVQVNEQLITNPIILTASEKASY